MNTLQETYLIYMTSEFSGIGEVSISTFPCRLGLKKMHIETELFLSFKIYKKLGLVIMAAFRAGLLAAMARNASRVPTTGRRDGPDWLEPYASVRSAHDLISSYAWTLSQHSRRKGSMVHVEPF